MAKKIIVIPNTAGGLDLLTERDSGNEVVILTGKKANSLDFWKRLRKAADEAVEELKGA